MRRYLLSLVVFLVVASAATGVHASTDCQRWFVEYKNSLAQSNAAKHLIAAKHRAHRYVHRKLAALHKPKPANKPRVLPARFPRPKMTREEALRRFNLACGDMPEDMPVAQMVHEEDPKPDFLASSQHDMPLEKPDGGGIVAKNVIPPFPPGGGWQYPPNFGGGGTAPGGPGTPTGGATPPDAPPVTPAPPGTPVTPVTPPVSPVPEPGSIVLMLTGVAGAAGMARRRFVR